MQAPAPRQLRPWLLGTLRRLAGAHRRAEARRRRREGHTGDATLVRALQDYVKATIAPYKYPRAIEFRDQLPRTETGQLQRFRLRA